VYGGNVKVDSLDAGDSIYVYDGANVIYGNAGSDSIYGYYGTNTAYGGQGNDSVYQYEGTALIYGNLGNDTMKASYSGVTMIGGQGNDLLSPTDSSIAKLTGGLGNDTFVLNSHDSATGINQDIGYNEITDFSTSDLLELQAQNGCL